jgi:hypothetical protein
LGSAFIDAYEYAEKQNWVGFVVTPSAEKKVSDIESMLKSQPHISLYQYTKYNVPVKKKRMSDDGVCQIVDDIEGLYVAKIYEYGAVVGCIEQMMLQAEQKHRQKFENTLKFFKETK